MLSEQTEDPGAFVVVGVELEDTDRDRAIAQTARKFAGETAELRLIHVHRLRQMAVMDYTYVEPPEWVAEELEIENVHLRAIADDVAGPTTVHVVLGSPVEAILGASAGASLLVIGRSHLGALSRVLGRSVESKLAHEAPCPVLIVP